MRKIVINKSYGGFVLSDKACTRLVELGIPDPINWIQDESRDNPLIIQVVEELGEKASGMFSKLKVVEIPDDIEWEIDEYDGNEHIAEVHRTWG